MKQKIQNFMKYKDLLVELVKNDLKVKYKNSYLGVLWSLINPLMMMIVLTIVFSAVFRHNIDNFPLYVLTGRLIYSFFSESTSFAMDSILSNGQLIKKVYLPKYLFPISRIVSSYITSIVAIIPIFLVMLITGVPFRWTMLQLIIPLLLLLAISLGIGLILSTIAVFFNDIKHLYSVILMILMYMTPIFYPAEIIPEKYRIIVELNPIYSILNMFRDSVQYQRLISIEDFLFSLFYAVIYLIGGLFIFYKKQDRFIFHL